MYNILHHFDKNQHPPLPRLHLRLPPALWPRSIRPCMPAAWGPPQRGARC